MIKTKITEMFGIQHPIIQGGMHFVGFAEMASAVSNSGALGIITGLTQPSPKDLANKVSQLLNDWTGEKWHILMTQEKGDLTLEEQSDMQKAKIIDDFSKDEKIKEILNIFPESKIEEVKKEGENNE